MSKLPKISFLTLLLCTTAIGASFAETERQLDAHEHGVGSLNIAIEGSTIAVEIEAPGADIVGFEYVASTDEDKAKIEEALGKLNTTSMVITFPAAANCTATEISAALISEDEHDDHDDDKHDDHDDDKHDDHDDDKHDDHDDDKHDDHDDDKHDDHDDDKHDDHDEHADEANHTEFHAEYAFTCGNISAATEANLPYFTSFPTSGELEAQIVTPKGATQAEANIDNAKIMLNM